MKMWIPWVLILSLTFSGGLSSTIDAFGRAGEHLALLPIQDTQINEDKVVVPELTPSFYDLAISRLQIKADEVVDSIWKALDNDREFRILQEKGLSKSILKMFGLMQSDIFALEQQLDGMNFERSLKTLAVPQNQATDWYATEREFSKILGKVQLHYGIFDDYMNNFESTTQLQLEDYARSIIQPGSTQKTAMLTTLKMLNAMSIPQDASNRTDIMFKVYQVYRVNQGNMCNLRQSPAQYLMNLYNLIALTEIKGYMMVQFSYIVFKMYGHDSLVMEADVSQRKFATNTAYKISFARELLAKSSQEFWHCDDKSQREGSSYVRMINLLQGHIENEVDMNSRGSCRDNCGTFKVAKTDGRCFKDMFCAKQKGCSGRLYDCQFFNADAWICKSQNRERKYDWIEYENGIELGQKSAQGQCVNKIKVDSWWRFLFHCSYCLCLCDAQGPDSDRYWSLLTHEADVSLNKVVTGVRFVKKNRVIHLEIEQATALPEGNIDQDTRIWIDAPMLDVNNQTQKAEMIKTMSYEERALDLDMLKAHKGHVITGVRLRDLGGHLGLEIRQTPINFNSGQLILDRSVWMGNDNTPAAVEVDKKRRRLELPYPDVPTKYMGQSKIDSQHNQYILFDATSAHKDVSKSTVGKKP